MKKIFQINLIFSLMIVSCMFIFLTTDPSNSSEKSKTLYGFGQHKFYIVDNSQPGGFKLVEDPLDPTNHQKVMKFTIKPAPCIGYDCDQQSARAALGQHPNAVQPKEAWYGWDMYFTKDFPNSAEQSRGFQIFNEFKDQFQCALAGLTIDHSTYDRIISWRLLKPNQRKATQTGGDCDVIFKGVVAEIDDISGSWHRFELFAKWSRKDDGKFRLYLDGKEVVNYSGPTCFSDCNKMNYYFVGNYLCCTPASKEIIEATVYYRYISRAKSRDKLKWE